MLFRSCYVRTYDAEKALEACVATANLDDYRGIGLYKKLGYIPYLFENDQLQKVSKQKIFLGFSDTTMNHLMLHKLGIKTFYGQSFLADICELDKEMLAYSLHYFKELIETGRISEIRPSNVWYEERTDFSPKALGTPRVNHANTGFELLQGKDRKSTRLNSSHSAKSRMPSSA